jgi:ribosome-binding protein aMBF1 (putative translation factor)
MEKEFICEICGQKVNPNELHRINNSQLNVTGHLECIRKQLEKQGLNESVSQIKKTNFLLG